MEKYLSTNETAEKWGVSERRVGQYCSEGRIPGAQRDIAEAEYHYFSGQPEKAAMEAEAYLDSEDMGARLSAYLIYTYRRLHRL